MSLPINMHDIHMWHDSQRVSTEHPWNPYPDSDEEVITPHRVWWENKTEVLWYKLEPREKAHYEYIDMMITWKGRIPIGEF